MHKLNTFCSDPVIGTKCSCKWATACLQPRSSAVPPTFLQILMNVVFFFISPMLLHFLKKLFKAGSLWKDHLQRICFYFGSECHNVTSCTGSERPTHTIFCPSAQVYGSRGPGWLHKHETLWVFQTSRHLRHGPGVLGNRQPLFHGRWGSDKHGHFQSACLFELLFYHHVFMCQASMRTTSCPTTTWFSQILQWRKWGRSCVSRSSDPTFPTAGRAARYVKIVDS